MKALILAGGLGTRLYPLTWGRPKSMVPLANRPFLARMLCWLRSHGIAEAILALNHLPQMISAQFGDGRALGMKLQYLLEEEPLGSGGAIKNAAHLLGNERFLVLNGDIFTDLDLGRMISFHASRRAQMSISLAWVAEPSAYGVVDMEADGRLRRFVEKPAAGEAPSNYINTGAWLFEPEMLAKMPPRGTPFSVEREFWPQSLEAGVPMFGYPGNCYWRDIGTVARYLQAHLDLLKGEIAVELEEVEHAPGIWIGAGAKIHQKASVLAPVIIGAGCEIGREAELTQAVIGPGTVVEEAAGVRNSVLWEQVRIGPGAQVANSVIGARQDIAGGEVLQQVALEDRGAGAPGK